MMVVFRLGKIFMGLDLFVLFYIVSKWLERCIVFGERGKNVKGKWKMECIYLNGWLVGSDEVVKFCICLVVWVY